MKTKIIVPVLFFIVLLWLAGCTSATQKQPEPKLNLANPAAVYCGEQGGEVDIRTTDDGAVGYCVFPDDSECEEWAFFYGKCEPKDSGIIGLPNPAAVYCEEQGGQLDAGICAFEDGSECDQWAFFRGECAPGDTSVGLPNPAAVYCEEQGGQPEIRANADGSQDGFCIFDDGSECEQWDYFHGECEPGETDTQLANPAAVHCEEEGGKSEIRTNADGSQDGYCIFDDGSECEQWAFLRGECKPGG